ncbi:MAG: DUF4832 domain-containing protein [Oscillospiraceae bacterium]
MNRLKTMCILLSMMLCAMSIPVVSVSAEEVTIGTSQMVDETLQKSTIDYTESTETLSNPGVGYTQTIWYTCKPNDTPVCNPTGNIALMFIDIGGFSSGINGFTDDQGNYTEGTDYDLDETFFTNLRATFENARKNGCTIAVRFRYDANGKSNPEPSTFDKVLQHIQQIKDDGILEEYKDILMFVESGFVGQWGEQHGGKYVSLEYKAQLLDAMLDCVPDDIPVTVRTPNTFAKWAGIDMKDLNSYVSTGDAKRVGMYNDGYMGSDTDLGTFTYNREEETNWLGRQTIYTYYGGEFSGDLDWAKKYDTYLPENAIPEMYKTHLSYINSNIYSLYKDYTFNTDYDVSNVDNSAYYGETVFKFIRDHIGYRFVLRNSELNRQVSQGGTLNLNFDVENTGFANPLKEEKVEVILEKDGKYITTQVDLNPMEWYSCSISNSKISLKTPATLESGNWNVYLRMSVGNQGISDSYLRCVKFANNDIWNTSLGANYLGTVEVVQSGDASQLTNNSFYQTNTENPKVSNADMYTYDGIVILDGQPSSANEWTEKSKLLEDGDNQLYVSNDDKNLYIMAKIVHSAESPVYNFRIANATNGETYWIYYQPNGFVYFNHNDSNAEGCIYKRVGDYVEFKVPFGDIMGLNDGVTLSSIEVNVQESAESGWPSVGRLKYEEEYLISSNYVIYTTERSINLKEGESFTLNVETSLDNATYQWYFNDIPIDNATNKSYTIVDATSKNVGNYSVLVRSESGVEKVTSICNVLNVCSSEELIGDINVDDTVNSLDLILMKKHLLGIATLTKDVISYADINQDGDINIIDFANLKRLIFS